MTVFLFLLMCILLSAVYHDLKTYHIPNRLILFGTGLGLLYQFVEGFLQKQGVLKNLGSCALLFLLSVLLLFLLIPLWKLRAFGGGDVKLLSMCVIYIGFGRSINSLFYALIIGVILAGVYDLFTRVFPKKLKKMEKKDGYHRIHFSLPILLGVLTESVAGMLIEIPF